MTTVARTIHIVDDDDMVRDSLKALLESRGFAVSDYASAAEFLARDQDAAGECVILDNHMPQMTGIELMRKLRERGDKVFVIMVTGRWDAASRAQADALGVQAFLEKPLFGARLFTEIERAMLQLAS